MSYRFLIIILLIVMLGFGATLIYKSVPKDTIQTEQITNLDENTESTKNTEDSEWSLYKNSLYKYELKYPENLTTKSNTGDSGNITAKSDTRALFIYENTSKDPYLERYIDLEVFQVDTSSTNATQIEINGTKMKKEPFMSTALFNTYVVPLKTGDYLQISVSKDLTRETLANKILETIKVEAAILPTEDSKPKKSVTGFTYGKYINCKIFSRSNMNIPVSSSTLPDKSTIVCDNTEPNETNVTILKIADKPRFETAKNSISRVWYDEEGYKAMLVDQEGAGSGEGNGKVVLLEKNGYKLLSCFYYTYENFHKNKNEPYGAYKTLTEEELESIQENPIELSSPSCSNFTLANYIN